MPIVPSLLLASALAVPTFRTVPADDTAYVRQLFDQALVSCCAQGTCTEEGGCAAPCAACEAGTCTDRHENPTRALVARLSADRGAFAELRDAYEAAFQGADAEGLRRPFLAGLLTWLDGEDVVACGERLFAADPEAFPSSAVVGLAAKGSKTFTRACETRAKAGELYPAAYLCLTQARIAPRAKDAHGARALLERTARAKELSSANLADALVAAHALERLGDPAPLARLRERAHATVLTALDEGRVDEARALALQAEFFARPGLLARPSALSHLSLELWLETSARAREVVDAQAVFEVIERVTPI